MQIVIYSRSRSKKNHQKNQTTVVFSYYLSHEERKRARECVVGRLSVSWGKAFSFRYYYTTTTTLIHEIVYNKKREGMRRVQAIGEKYRVSMNKEILFEQKPAPQIRVRFSVKPKSEQA